jgi:hypothetical protein
VVKFEVIKGGLQEEDFPITKPDGTLPPSKDWLRTLPFETRFVCKHKADQGSLLDCYGIVAILPEAVLLYDFGERIQNPMKWHISEKFSRNRELIAILPTSSEEGENNEQHHLSVAEPRQVHDGHEGEPSGVPEA